MNLNLEHLSYSSISTYLSCPKSFKFKYIEKQPTIASPELVFGSAIHNTIESYLTSDRKRLPVTFWKPVWSKQIEGEKIAWGDSTPEQHFNNGVNILSNNQIIDNLNSILPGKDHKGKFLVEQKIELRVPGVPLPIIGYIDIQTRDGIPGDFKTSARSWTQEKAQNETQSLFYLAALNQAGIHEHQWRFRHFVIVKTKTPQFQIFEHTHQPSEIIWLFGMIKQVWKGIKSGVFPENPGSWLCSENYCNFFKMCRGKYS